MRTLTYKKAGVDIEKADRLLRRIKDLAKHTQSSCVLKDVGAFGSLFKFDTKRYKQPVLVASADGVGTKLKIAGLINRHDTVGIDLVAMNVNDILATGAQPLFFLDYISTGKLNERIYLDVIKGIAKGCALAGCALAGGETAQMPGMYKKNEYDVAGFCVGVVEKDRIINGKDIKVGDVILGLSSSGLHSNGFSLVRKVFSIKQQKHLAKKLLIPTRIYVRPVLALAQKINIKGIAHITGGAFYQKLSKIIPKGLACLINKDSWRVPAIFKLIQKTGNIPQKDMYRTFNMGIGITLVLDKRNVDFAKRYLSKSGIKSYIIGEIIKGNKGTIIV